MTPLSNAPTAQQGPGATPVSSRAEAHTNPKEGPTMVAHDRRSAKSASTRGHLTITDVCDELGVARSTFYDWRAGHKAPRCIKLPNGEIRIRRADFESWLTSLEDVA